MKATKINSVPVMPENKLQTTTEPLETPKQEKIAATKSTKASEPPQSLLALEVDSSVPAPAEDALSPAPEPKEIAAIKSEKAKDTPVKKDINPVTAQADIIPLPEPVATPPAKAKKRDPIIWADKKKPETLKVASKDIKPELAVTKPEEIQPASSGLETAKTEAKEAPKAAAKTETPVKTAMLSPKVDVKKIQVWEAGEGSGLKRVLRKWSEQAGYTLEWKTEKRLELEMDMYINGTVENALKTLFSLGIKDGPSYALDAQKGVLTISD